VGFILFVLTPSGDARGGVVMPGPTLSDRLALAVCRTTGNPDGSCFAICRDCRRDSAAVAHEIANWLRERHGGSSTTADLLDGVGCHPHGASQP
jgi:hypothetical protein